MTYFQHVEQIVFIKNQVVTGRSLSQSNDKMDTNTYISE